VNRGLKNSADKLRNYNNISFSNYTWGKKKNKNKLIYLQESRSDSRWIILKSEKSQDRSLIGFVFWVSADILARARVILKL